MTPTEARAEYRSMLSEIGEDVFVRRYTGAMPDRPMFEAKALARVTGNAPKDFAGTLQQGDKFPLVLAEDLEHAQFPLPLRNTDKVVIRGLEHAIIGPPDRYTRSLAGVIVAYELQVRGA